LKEQMMTARRNTRYALPFSFLPALPVLHLWISPQAPLPAIPQAPSSRLAGPEPVPQPLAFRPGLRIGHLTEIFFCLWLDPLREPVQDVHYLMVPAPLLLYLRVYIRKGAPYAEVTIGHNEPGCQWACKNPPLWALKIPPLPDLTGGGYGTREGVYA